MRVVDEETLHAADLETEAPKDDESPKEETPIPIIETPEIPVKEEPIKEEPVKEKPKRKPRKPKESKGEILVPALEKKSAFVEPSKLRKERLKEKIECPNGCGKMVTRHAASYIHNKTCSALKEKESASQTTPEFSESTYVEPDFEKKEAEKVLRRQQNVHPNVDFMERLKRAAVAYREIEDEKHAFLIRQYFRR